MRLGLRTRQTMLIRGREFLDYLPAYWAAPEFNRSLGGVVGALCADSGQELDQWQQLAVHLMWGVHPEPPEKEKARAPGWPFIWASPEDVLIIARQMGKGYVLEGSEAMHLFLLPTRRIVHTAHLTETATDALERLVDFIDRSPKLKRHVRPKAVLRGNGKHSISVRSIDGRPPSRIIFRTRTADGMRGLYGEYLIVDEAYAVTQDQLAAVMPTQTVQPNAKTMFTSSAGMESSKVLNGMLRQAKEDNETHKAEGVSIVYCALPPKDMDGNRLKDPAGKVLPVDLDDTEEFKRANPSPRITWAYALRERKRLGDERYARERLSVIPEIDEDMSLNPKLWSACIDEKAQRSGDLVLAIDVSPGCRCASVVACGQMADGRRLIEIAKHGQGIDWVPEWLEKTEKLKRPRRIVMDGAGPGVILLDKLKKRGVKVEIIRASESTTAAAQLIEDVKAGRIAHLGDETLRSAVDYGVLRTTGDGLVKWTRAKSSVDICTLVAATMGNYRLALLAVGGKAAEIW